VEGWRSTRCGCTGRVPISKDLNLASVGVQTQRAFIPVDDAMRVLAHTRAVATFWAVGECDPGR